MGLQKVRHNIVTEQQQSVFVAEPTILMTTNFSTVWNQGAWYLQLFSFSILLWLFVVFYVFIQIFGLFIPVLWKMPCVFWQELHLENSIEIRDCFWWYRYYFFQSMYTVYLFIYLCYLPFLSSLSYSFQVFHLLC